MIKFLTIAILTVATITTAPAVAASSHPAQSPRAADLMGIEASLYRGEHYNPKRWEAFRRCVVQRESRGNYRAANTSSSARGAYQFLDRSWRESLVWMLLPEHKPLGLADEVRALADKPIHHWNRYWQDAAFWTVINAKPGAWQHWRGGSCDRLA